MSKKVIVTGVTGQDGSYMVEYLLKNTDFDIIGMARRSANLNFSHLKSCIDNPRFHITLGDLSDAQSIDTMVREHMPDYFVNFAAQSFVGSSWKIPEQTFETCAMGPLRCLEAIRKHVPQCRFYNAGSSEEMGDVIYSPQDMDHPARARSPYGAAKIAARQIVKVYRESYNLFAIQGLLYNHESERRGEEFVTRKITKAAARIKKAIDKHLPFDALELGNIDAKRDWSHAEDFVDGIWLMLNNHAPIEYILSSGETHSIREFLTKAFVQAGIVGQWTGEGQDEILYTFQHGGVTRDAKTLVKINPEFYRPAEVELLLGNSAPARYSLGWKPKNDFNTLVKRMVDHDLRRQP